MRTEGRMWEPVLLVIGVAMGLAIAWMDSRPHWDDAGITAGSLLLSAMVLGAMAPRRAWICGLAVGMWVPLHLMVGAVTAHRVTLGTAGYLVILAFPMAGAYAGMGLRKIFARA
jgi:uncharacterized membrane protein